GSIRPCKSSLRRWIPSLMTGCIPNLIVISFAISRKMTMIKVENVYKTLGDQKVLEGISFEASEGEIVALLGLSGAGKTVLLKHLIGLFRPDEGEVVVDGQNL